MIIKNLQRSKIKVETGDVISTVEGNYFFIAFYPRENEYVLIDLTTYELLDSWDKIDWIDIGSTINGEYTVANIIKDKNIELILH